MKYGRAISTTIINGLATAQVHNLVNSQEASKFTDFIERVPVRNITDIHAEFLKLLDLYAKDEVKAMGVQLIERSGKPQFLDKYWTVYEEIKE